ncbi:MAG TPA: response regulator, partial [Opitutus sp.]|nr:response regulator [Opitutus sp.]
GGWLELTSEVGVGTTFTVFLPEADARTGSAVKTAAPETAVSGGRETLLIVEDEPSVREFTAAVLRPLGYRLLQARSGVDALELWKRHSAQIDLLLTDMVMPDQLTGPQLATALVAQKPSLAVVFTSGYSQESIGRVFPPEKGARFIHKPYSPRDLAKIVRETLDRRKRVSAAASASMR